MSDLVRKLNDLKEQIDETAKRKERCLGAITQIKKDIKKQLGVPSVLKAVRKLRAMESEEAKLRASFEKQIERISKLMWGSN